MRNGVSLLIVRVHQNLHWKWKWSKDPELNEPGYCVLGAPKLDHLLSFKPIFWTENFANFSLSCWGAQSYYPRGLIMGKWISSNFRIEWDRGDWVPGASKLDLLQPFKPILSQIIFNFFTFILGAQSYYPRGLIMGKWNSSNFRIEWDSGDWMPGASKLKPNLITPEG